MVSPGPLVVVGRRWGLPDGTRGALERSVALEAALRGLPVALVLDSTGVELWAEEDQATVDAIGTDGEGGPWRYRVTVPGAEPVTLVLVQRDSGQHSGPWAGLTGTEACLVLRAVGDVLGVAWSHSVGRTAEQLILDTHPRRRGGRSLERAPSIPGPATSARLEQPWAAWQRPLDESERTAAWVHTFDANAAFLGAWQTAELGFGKVEHFTTARGCEPRVAAAGVWRVELPEGWSDGAGLPPIAPGLRRTDTGNLAGWVMTPTLARLRQWAADTGQGEVIPEEGHVWPERSRFLRAAGERLRNLRADTLEAESMAAGMLKDPALTEELAEQYLGVLVTAGAAREAVRDLYTITVGRFSSHEPHIPAAWRRPDWANTIRAEWRTNLHRKLAHWSATGPAPFAVATDAVAYATDEPDAEAFARWLGLRLGTGLGEFKHQGTVERGLATRHLGLGARQVSGVFTAAARGQ